MTPSEHTLAPCLCRSPRPGPQHWDWRCLECSGSMPSDWEILRRMFGRKPR